MQDRPYLRFDMAAADACVTAADAVMVGRRMVIACYLLDRGTQP